MGRRPSEPKTDLAERLKLAREVACGGDRERFSSITGISKTTIGNYERGDRVPDAVMLRKYRDATGVDLTWLVTGEGSMMPAASLANFPDSGADWVIKGPEGEAQIEAKRYQASRTPPEVDIDRLERAILIIELGIEGLDDRPTSAEKAELIAVAYQMYQAPTANTEQLILRMVKGPKITNAHDSRS